MSPFMMHLLWTEHMRCRLIIMHRLSTAACVFLLATVGGSLIRGQEQGTVVRLDPALDSIIASDAKLEHLTDTPGLGTREGPIWIRKGEYLLY